MGDAAKGRSHDDKSFFVIVGVAWGAVGSYCTILAKARVAQSLTERQLNHECHNAGIQTVWL